MNKRHILYFICTIIGMSMFTSCGTMFYGESTKVTIESKEGNKDKVNIVAMGSKQVQEFNDVTLPFEMDVIHNNFPLGIHVYSSENNYKPFNMEYKTKGNEIIKPVRIPLMILGFGGAAASIVGLATGAEEIIACGLIGSAIGGFGGMILETTTPTKVPFFNSYSVESSINDSKIVLDKLIAYKQFLNKENANSLNTINCLLKKDTTPELMYMKSLVYYQAGYRNDAIKYLDLAYSIEKKNSSDNKLMADYEHIKELFNQVTYDKIANKSLESADTIVGWLLSKEVSSENLYMKGLIYTLKDDLRQGQKSLEKAYQLSDKYENPKLHQNIKELLDEVVDLRYAKKQKNINNLLNFAEAMVVGAGVVTSSSDIHGNNYSGGGYVPINTYSGGSETDYNADEANRARWENTYLDIYRRYENNVKNNVESYYKAKARGRNGTYSGTDMAYLNKLIFLTKDSQEEMRKTRSEAAKKGINIPISKYETISLN